jgi:hypothetical protein
MTIKSALDPFKQSNESGADLTPFFSKRVIFRGIADNPYCKDDGFRHQDLVLRREVERRMLGLYAELGVRVDREA